MRQLNGKVAVASSRYGKERDYWLAKLEGDIQPVQFPYDRRITPPGEEEEPQKDSYRFTLSDVLFSKLMEIGNQSDPRVHMLLTAGFVLLLHRYSGGSDIITGTTIYKQAVEAEFVNTLLALRNHVKEGMTFKELIFQVRETVVEAVKHQNYPMETLLYDLKMSHTGGPFPLFQTALLLENIHDPGYIRHIDLGIVFLFKKNPGNLSGTVLYHSSLYEPETVRRIVRHFETLLLAALSEPRAPVDDIEILSPPEKEQLLIDFNRTSDSGPDSGLSPLTPFTLHQVFEAQVEKTPDKIAVIFEKNSLTYSELNYRANRLAARLKRLGVTPGTIVGIIVHRSVEMAVGLLGILKAGGAYLPIAPTYPTARIAYMLKQCRVGILVKGHRCEIESHVPCIIDLHDPSLYREDESNPRVPVKPHHLAYIIFTSGTTGMPKGAAVEHRNAVNTLAYRKNIYSLDEHNTSLQLFAFVFDGFVTSFFTPLLAGSPQVLLSEEEIKDFDHIKEIIVNNNITHFISVPSLYRGIIENLSFHEAAGLKVITLAGEALSPDIIEKTKYKNPQIEIVNEYGVTEAGVMSTIHRHQEQDTVIRIGKPISNTRLYIVDSRDRLVPVGVYGDLCIAGAGVARGYVNNPKLTNQRFVTRAFSPHKEERVFRTGDIVRWLPDGSIQFKGRDDFQVKLRGYRIELGEIEAQLLTHEGVKEAAVTVRTPQNTPAAGLEKDKFLCAYIVPDTRFTLSSAQLREYLSQIVPDYMIPTFFVQLDALPVTINGKVDRKALPEPQYKTTAQYTAPRDPLEKSITAIWSEILGIEAQKIGIDDDFFQLGGQSLKATILLSQIHKELNVKLSLVDVFRESTIRQQAQLMGTIDENPFESIEPAPQKDYYPLSSPQNRLFLIQQMNPDSMAYNVPQVILLNVNVNEDVNVKIDRHRLEDIFKQLIQRHESLRTSFDVIDHIPVQKIHPHVPFEVQYHKIQADDDSPESVTLVNRFMKQFIRPFDLSSPPLLRAGLMETMDGKCILAVDMHHIICDGVSHQVLTRDFTSLWQGEPLPPLRLQYKDYSQWRAGEKGKGVFKLQEEYWADRFKDNIPVLDLPTDYPRPDERGFEGGAVNFLLDSRLTQQVKEFVSQTGATLYMVFLAVYSILISRYSRQQDIVIGSPVKGRRHADLEDIIGLFINMVALRCQPAGTKEFPQYLEEVKQITLDALKNQEYEFDELVNRLGLQGKTHRNPLFDIAFTMQNIARQIPGTHEETIEDKYDYQDKTTRFDLHLIAVDGGEQFRMRFEYSTLLFKEKTIQKIIQRFINVLEQVVGNPAIQIKDIQIPFDLAPITTNVLATETPGFNF